MRRARFAAVLSLAALALGSGAFAQSIEENRYAGELKACAQRPEAERKACEDAVRAKIKAEWTRRIEIESRRRHNN
ncbi:MAG: hypothetical protein ACT4N4_18135 [Rhodospirillales bacterium]